MAPPARPASPAQVSELGKIVFKFRRARQPRHHRSELGKIVFKIFGGRKFGGVVGVVVEPSTNRKAKGIRYSCCGASPAFAQTQPSPFLWLRLCCLVFQNFNIFSPKFAYFHSCRPVRRNFRRIFPEFHRMLKNCLKSQIFFQTFPTFCEIPLQKDAKL